MSTYFRHQTLQRTARPPQLDFASQTVHLAFSCSIGLLCELSLRVTQYGLNDVLILFENGG
jgi:hypothetical protein